MGAPSPNFRRHGFVSASCPFKSGTRADTDRDCGDSQRLKQEREHRPVAPKFRFVPKDSFQSLAFFIAGLLLFLKGAVLPYRGFLVVEAARARHAVLRLLLWTEKNGRNLRVGGRWVQNQIVISLFPNQQTLDGRDAIACCAAALLRRC